MQQEQLKKTFLGGGGAVVPVSDESLVVDRSAEGARGSSVCCERLEGLQTELMEEVRAGEQHSSA